MRRANPGGLTLARAGPATSHHIGFEVLKRAANVDLTHVLYPGTAPAVTALLGEHVTAVFAEYPATAEQIKAGSLRALAVTTAMRSEALPDVFTVAESGYNNYEVSQWLGLFAPAKTPKEAVSQPRIRGRGAGVDESGDD